MFTMALKSSLARTGLPLGGSIEAIGHLNLDGDVPLSAVAQCFADLQRHVHMMSRDMAPIYYTRGNDRKAACSPSRALTDSERLIQPSRLNAVRSARKGT